MTWDWSADCLMVFQREGACAGELMSGSEQGTVSIFDVNHLADPVATLTVCPLTRL